MGKKLEINKTNIIIYCWTHNNNKMCTKDILVLLYRPYLFFGPVVDQTHLTFGRQLTFGRYRHGINLLALLLVRLYAKYHG